MAAPGVGVVAAEVEVFVGGFPAAAAAVVADGPSSTTEPR